MDPEDINIAEEVVMQFGRYKDKPLKDISLGYVHWLAENHDCEFLCTAANTVYEDRRE